MSGSGTGSALKLFYSCSAADHELRSELEKHLAALEREGLIAGWHSRLVLPGSELSKTVNKYLDEAAIILLLVSSDFLASDYCSGIDVRRAMARHECGDAVVVPVILRPCDWASAPFASCSVLPSDGRPIVKWEHRDDGFLEVARGVRTLVNHLRGELKQQSKLPAASRATARVERELVDKLEQLSIEKDECKADEMRSAKLTSQIDVIVRELNMRERPRAGDWVAGAELVKQLGSGSFATVWLSKQPATGKFLATKIIDRDRLTQGVMLWRFRRGIRAMGHLGRISPHQHIALLREVDESTLAFSMDYLSEGNLENIERRGWTLAKKIDVMVTLCDAVQFAHSNGIIHRDIKPANIVLDANYQPVLTDFDIVDIKFSATLSAVEGGLGTPMFAAPEQYIDSSKSDERSDVYSLGRLLYFLLLERSPGLQIESDPDLTNLTMYPATLVAIVRRATQYAPEKRYSSVMQMRQAIMAHQTRRAFVLTSIGRGARFVGKNLAFAAALVIVVVGVLIFAMRERASAERERTAAASQKELAAELASVVARVDATLTDLKNNNSQKSNIADEERVVRQDIGQLEAAIKKAATDRERKELEQRLRQRTDRLMWLELQTTKLEVEAKKLQADLDASREKGLRAQHGVRSPASRGVCTCIGDVYTSGVYEKREIKLSSEQDCSDWCQNKVCIKGEGICSNFFSEQ